MPGQDRLGVRAICQRRDLHPGECLFGKGNLGITASQALRHSIPQCLSVVDRIFRTIMGPSARHHPS